MAIADTPLSDIFFGGGTTFKAINDKVYFLAMHKYENDIYCLDQNNTINKVTKFNGSINCFDTNDKDIIFNGSSNDSLNNIYRYSNNKLSIIYDINGSLLNDKYVAKGEHVTFTNSNNDLLDGWVLKPIDYNPNKKYPAILEIHGGPIRYLSCLISILFFLLFIS